MLLKSERAQRHRETVRRLADRSQDVFRVMLNELRVQVDSDPGSFLATVTGIPMTEAALDTFS